MTNKSQPTDTENSAIRLANATQKPGQTKEQTKLIAQGIQHGIDQYKKQQKVKSREIDKQKKRQQRQKNTEIIEQQITETPSKKTQLNWLPWGLLLLSWIGFGAYLLLIKS
jgi:hypothetical protein